MSAPAPPGYNKDKTHDQEDMPLLLFLSPAKNMRACPRTPPCVTAPRFLPQTWALCDRLRGLAPYELESLLRVSPALALRACRDFAAWQPAGGQAAALSYDGLAYKNLDAPSLTDADLLYAQDHLRILSAFYGVLRPLDAIRPYRLEMNHRPDGLSLYEFWGGALARDLFADGGPVVNLASREYSRAVSDHLSPGQQLLTCEFLTYRSGKLRALATLAKMARGRMARFAIQNRIDRPDGLAGFAWNGFTFEPALSNAASLVFVQRGE